MSEHAIHIKSLQWELETSTLNSARDWQEEISKFSNDKIAGIINESLQDKLERNETLVIPLIELKLPPLTNPGDIASSFEKVWKEALEEKMLERVLVKKGVLQGDPAIEKNIIEQLLVYFKTGNISWYSDRSKLEDKVELTRLMLEYPSEVIAKLIRAISRDEESTKRFIQLFSEEQLVQLLQYAKLYDGDSERLLRTANGLFKKWLVDWQNHGYRTFILFALIIQKIRGELFNESLERIISSWWVRIVTEHYFLPEVINTISDNIGNSSMTKGGLPGIVDEVEHLITSVVLKEIQVTNGIHGSHVIDRRDESNSASRDINSMTNEGQSYFIENAGIILLYPCLKNWFRNEGFIDDRNEFVSQLAQMEASRLLQYIALGTSDFMEYHLVLNKVLCGYSLGKAVYGEQNIIEKKEEYTNERILELLGGWEKLKNTSVGVFRSSFLIRNGKLTEEDDHYFLRVDRKGLDVLLGSYPFPKNIIKLPWMVKPLYTEW
jgi:hypothetical protein